MRLSSDQPAKAHTDVTRCMVCGRSIRDADNCDYVYDDDNRQLGAIHPEHYGGLLRLVTAVPTQARKRTRAHGASATRVPAASADLATALAVSA